MVGLTGLELLLLRKFRALIRAQQLRFGQARYNARALLLPVQRSLTSAILSA